MNFQDTLSTYIKEQLKKDDPFHGLTGTALIKAKCKAKVKAKFDKIDEDRKQSIKQHKRQEEVKAFLKSHSAKMKQKIIEDKIAGKY